MKLLGVFQNMNVNRVQEKFLGLQNGEKMKNKFVVGDRKYVSAHFEKVDYYSLKQLEEALARAKDAVNDGLWKDIRISTESRSHYGDEYFEIYLVGYRLETDKEYQERIQMEESQKDYRRRMYESLKKEFEDA